MGLLVDSSVLIRYERRGLSPRNLLDDLDEELATAAVCISELLVGLHRASTDAQRTQRIAFIDETIRLLDVLPFDLPAARIHAEIRVELFRTGQIIGAADALIAATALANGLGVLTENVREFERVPDLFVEQPK